MTQGAKHKLKASKHLPRLPRFNKMGLEELQDTMPRRGAEMLESTMEYLSPREQVSTLRWFIKYARNTDGRPYSHSLFPHLGAPGGPSCAMDDPSVRRVWLQFASRLGKTYFGQCCAMKKADTNPGPMMLASSVEKTAVEVTERTYKIFENSPRVAWQLRASHRRKQSRMDFDACQCMVAWSRSVSTLADKEVEFGHANEIDKWEHTSTSREAHPLKLFADRFKNRPHFKNILESTPSVRGNSQVESGRLGSTNCQLYVPCPHCVKYQTLKMKDDDGNYLLKWEKLENGKQDKDLARKTAYYECIHCKKRIEDHHRPQMMRLGVWCPEGARIRHKEAYRVASEHYASTIPDLESKSEDMLFPPETFEWEGWSEATWIMDNPVRDSVDAGYQLSSLYALSLTWGDIAAEFINCKDKPQELRNFINQWLAETWEHIRRKTTWEQLGIKIINNDAPRTMVPDWASTLVVGIDRQSEDGSRFPWVVDAYGVTNSVHTVAYGEAKGFDELLQKVLMKSWPRMDGNTSMSIRFGLIDSGYRPDGVYEFCGRCHSQKFNLWPVKGSSTALISDYQQTVLGENTSMPNMTLILADTIRSQLWMESQIYEEGSGYSLCAGSLLDHQDFLEQILNDAPVEKLDPSNNIRQGWERVNTGIPNDFRDCRRYAYVAKLIVSGGRDLPPPPQRPQTNVQVAEPKKKSAVISPGVSRPDGRSWLE